MDAERPLPGSRWGFTVTFAYHPPGGAPVQESSFTVRLLPMALIVGGLTAVALVLRGFDRLDHALDDILPHPPQPEAVRLADRETSERIKALERRERAGESSVSAPGHDPEQATDIITPLNVRDPAALVMPPAVSTFPPEAAAPRRPPEPPQREESLPKRLLAPDDLPKDF